VFGSGFLANLGTIPALVVKGDTIVMDELAHACMHGEAKLSGAQVRLFRHNDVADAARQIAGAPGQVRLLTETVFSMDGMGNACEDLHLILKGILLSGGRGEPSWRDLQFY
jgi:8-amino-7-oxononanoate synthase